MMKCRNSSLLKRCCRRIGNMLAVVDKVDTNTAVVAIFAI